MMKLTARWLIIPAFTVFFTCTAAASDLTGQQLAQKVFDRDRGQDVTSSAQMVLVNSSGKKKARKLVTLRVTENGLEQQLLQFTDPADIKGTGFLTIEQPGWETEQFLYLPALRRTRRIVASQKSSRFVNTDFTYEDMERHPVDNYTYKITGSAKVGDIECYILESSPKPGVESQYSKTISHVTKESYVPLVAEYFDDKGTHIKTYKVMKLENVQGIFTEMVISMSDLKKKHTTYIKLESVDYNKGITKDDVSRNKLETPL